MTITTAKSKSGATLYYVDGKKTAKDEAMKVAEKSGYPVYKVCFYEHRGHSFFRYSHYEGYFLQLMRRSNFCLVFVNQQPLKAVILSLKSISTIF